MTENSGRVFFRIYWRSNSPFRTGCSANAFCKVRMAGSEVMCRSVILAMMLWLFRTANRIQPYFFIHILMNGYGTVTKPLRSS